MLYEPPGGIPSNCRWLVERDRALQETLGLLEWP